MKTKSVLSATLSLVYLMNLAPSMVLAQSRSTVVPGIAPIITAEAGRYEISDTQVSPVLQTILNLDSKVKDADRAYIIGVEKQVRAEYNLLLKAILGDFTTLSNETTQGDKMVKAAEFMKQVQKINELKASVEIAVDSLTSLADSMPSASTVNLEGKNQTASQYFNLNFDKLVKVYQDKIAALIAAANKLSFKLELSNGIPQVITENALSPQLSTPLYTPAQLENMQKEIGTITAKIEVRLYKDREDLGGKLKENIATFAQMYGEDESFRFRGDKDKDGNTIETYYGARNKMYTDMVNLFWTRSYLRAKYGMQLGAIQPIKYVKKAGNIDRFTVRTRLMNTFRQELAVNKSDLDAAFENMRNWMIVADQRSQEIFSENTGLSKGKNFFAALLVKANALKTFVTGNRPNAEVSLMVARLIFADIMEEQMLQQTGGRNQLFNFYKTRYQTSDENKSIYSGMKCNFDKYFANSPSGQRECTAALAGTIKDINAGGAGDINGILSTINDKMMISQSDVDRANLLRNEIMKSVMSGATASQANDDAGRL